METKVIKITAPSESVTELKEAAQILREGGLGAGGLPYRDGLRSGR